MEINEESVDRIELITQLIMDEFKNKNIDPKMAVCVLSTCLMRTFISVGFPENKVKEFNDKFLEAYVRYYT